MHSFLSNPVNAFLLIKRQTSDWQELEDRIKVNFAEGNNYTAFNLFSAWNSIFIPEILNKVKAMYDTADEQHKMVSENDLNLAATAVSKIQEVYQVDATKIADGEFKSINTK